MKVHQMKRPAGSPAVDLIAQQIANEHQRRREQQAADTEAARRRQEIEAANKFMLIGVEWTLKKLGADGGLLETFIRQEFQTWLQSAEAPIRAARTKGAHERSKATQNPRRSR